MALDHIGLAVADIAKSKSFYQKALAPLGYEIVMDFGEAVGLGQPGKPDFWIAKGKAAAASHVAFAASKRAVVTAFYDAAIAAGGRDNGAPGLRPQYHPNYYGAFIIDPDGNNVEAVCHQPE
jgi:catechol 2,3-dioxygenase-like lactoylglutathione lyase family enzyme